MFAAAIVMILALMLLTGCSAKVEGVYSAKESPYGASVTMTLKDGIVQMNIMGFFSMNGVYAVQRDYITIKINMYGQDETLTGKIQGNKIVFADMTLEKL